MMPVLLTVLLLSTVTATPDGGLIEPVIVRSPVVEVRTGVVRASLMVVCASAGAAQSRADRLTIVGPKRSANEAFRAAFGEKYPLIYLDPSRPTDRLSMIVASP